MFNVSGPELLIIAVLALIVLGPDRLPEAARKIGQVMGELRKVSTGFQAEMRDAMREPIRATQDTLDAAKGHFNAMEAATPAAIPDPGLPDAPGEGAEAAAGTAAGPRPDPDAPAPDAPHPDTAPDAATPDTAPDVPRPYAARPDTPAPDARPDPAA